MNDVQTWSPCFQAVVCSGCDRQYTCLPNDDYFNSTCATDGVCLKCLCVNDGPSLNAIVIVRHQRSNVPPLSLN